MPGVRVCRDQPARCEGVEVSTSEGRANHPGAESCARLGNGACAASKEGLKTGWEGSYPAESDDAAGTGEVPKYYPQPAGTRPKARVCTLGLEINLRAF